VVKNYILALNLILVLALGTYVVLKDIRQEKKGYVLNQRVFDEFTGKKELEEKLSQLSNTHKKHLDSLALVVQTNSGNKNLVDDYNETLRNFELQHQELSQRYTADIWKRINQYLSDYGKENGYAFIFGATGDGSLMYAGESNDITDEVIKHINKSYLEGE
jgi:outer membrane protein